MIKQECGTINNKAIRVVLEWGAALVFALLIINTICMMYVREPAGVERDGGPIYAASQPDIVTVNGEEGYGINRVDENGYINSSTKFADEGYILILGNSMTRGVNVMPEDRYVQQLSRMIAMDCGGDTSQTAYVYSISRGGALFAELASGYDAAIAEFPNAKAVVIQLAFSNRDRMLSQEYLDQVYDQRIYDDTQKVSYILEREERISSIRHWVKNSFPIISFAQNRRLNKISHSFDGAFGISRFIKSNSSNIDNAGGVGYLDIVGDNDEYEYDLRPLIDALEYLNNKNDIPLIILDMPDIASVDEEKIEYNLYQQNDWKEACAEAGVIFISMTDEFQDLYKNEKKLPYGYVNTSLGKGHLNKDGNRVVAKALYNALKDMEVIE